MFPKTRNIETAFRHVRFFTALVVLGSITLSAFIAWHSFRAMEKARSTIYVLNSGKALEAAAADRMDNMPVEARDHIRSFHQNFFTLSPDERQITAGITRALYLADASAKNLYENLKESGYFAGIIAGNISQEIAVDSIRLDMRSYPFYFRCYATEKIIRPTSLVTRNLLTEGWLRTTSRSDNDPHGFLVERWSILDNRDVTVVNR